jgi:hypothetical protein
MGKQHCYGALLGDARIRHREKALGIYNVYNYSP